MRPRRSPEATRELRAGLIEHAQRLVQRDGLQALTMRALATESGYAVGLPYKVFANRDELIAELVYLELSRLREALDAWVGTAGHRTIGENLVEYARILFETERPVLTHGLDSSVIAAKAEESGLPRSFEWAVVDYLAAEQRLSRVAAEVDTRAYGFLITGAIHNLVTAGEAYPRPEADELERMLHALARHLTPGGTQTPAATP